MMIFMIGISSFLGNLRLMINFWWLVGIKTEHKLGMIHVMKHKLVISLLRLIRKLELLKKSWNFVVNSLPFPSVKTLNISFNNSRSIHNNNIKTKTKTLATCWSKSNFTSLVCFCLLHLHDSPKLWTHSNLSFIFALLCETVFFY